MIIYLIALAALGFLLFIFYVSYRLVRPPRYVGEWTPSDLGMEYEDISLTTEDGIRLEGWWVDRGSDRTVVLLHGYTVSRWAFYIRKMMEYLSGEDYNILTFDFRAHGRSEGRYTTFGYSEILDFRAALDWLRKEVPERSRTVGVVGYSMGGVVAIRALAEELAAAGVADSPPVLTDRSAARGLRYFAGLPSIFYPLVRFFARLLTGAETVDVIALARNIRRPLLLIVGREDPLVKVEEVERFARINGEVNPDVEVWVGDGGHVRVIEAEPEEYGERVLNFLSRHLRLS